MPPGSWGVVGNDGWIRNQTANTPLKNNKLVMGNMSLYEYEAQDIKGGATSTLEMFGIRYQVNLVGYVGDPVNGDEMAVSVDADSLGRLISVADLARARKTGTYEIVAVCHQRNALTAVAEFETVSPFERTL